MVVGPRGERPAERRGVRGRFGVARRYGVDALLPGVLRRHGCETLRRQRFNTRLAADWVGLSARLPAPATRRLDNGVRVLL